MRLKQNPNARELVDSDGIKHYYCALCSMGLPDIQDIPKFTDSHGKTIYFCCERCKKNALRLLKH